MKPTQPHIVCTVTNDLRYDQRMQRIAGTLVANGYQVTLVGRLLPASIALPEQPFAQVRLKCRFHKGFLFYAEYNLRLFRWLLQADYDAVCTVDLDTLPAGCMATVLRRKKRVFDAHEYFTEVPEVVGRPFVKAFWGLVARCFLPFYRHAYTVGPSLADLFTRLYRIPFKVVRNVPRARTGALPPESPARIILYQGALNAGRGIEPMLEAMTQLEGVTLWLAGEGDLSDSLRQMAVALGVQDKVRFLGFVPPEQLQAYTDQAWLGLNLLENKGLSYYYSLANKFFDCVQSQVPVLTVDFPEYRALNAQYQVAVLLQDIHPDTIAQAIEVLLNAPKTYDNLTLQCRLAAQNWIWEKEEKTLLEVWCAALKDTR